MISRIKEHLNILSDTLNPIDIDNIFSFGTARVYRVEKPSKDGRERVRLHCPELKKETGEEAVAQVRAQTYKVNDQAQILQILRRFSHEYRLRPWCQADNKPDAKEIRQLPIVFFCDSED